MRRGRGGRPPLYTLGVPYPQTNLQLYVQLRGWATADLRRIRDSHDLARLLFSARYRGSGKPFLAHLVGTAGILAAHGADVATVCAGLLHAAYDQGDFGLRGRRRAASRRRLRLAAGADAEEIVWRYASLRWEDPDIDRRALFVGIANTLEETLDLGLLYVGSRKRAAELRTLDRAIDAAERHGFGALARELREGRAAHAAGTVPAELVDGREGSYTLPPPSYRRRLLCAAKAIFRRR